MKISLTISKGRLWIVRGEWARKARDLVMGPLCSAALSGDWTAREQVGYHFGFLCEGSECSLQALALAPSEVAFSCESEVVTQP